MFRKTITVFVFCLLGIVPAWGHPVADFMKAHPEVSGISFAAEGTPPSRITFVAGTSQAVMDSIKSAAKSFDWSYVPPDPVGLKKALNDSKDLPDEVKVALQPHLILLQSYTADPQGTKEAWLRTKTVLNLDPAVAAAIEAYAAQFGMPLSK